MKNYLVIIFLMLAAPLAVVAQDTGIDGLYDKYSGQGGYVTFEMNGETLRLMFEEGKGKIENPFEGVEVIRSVVAPAEDEAFKEEIKKLPDEGGYKMLVSMNEKDVSSILYFRAAVSSKKTAEFLIVAFGAKESSVICVVGNVHPANVTGMLGGMKR